MSSQNNIITNTGSHNNPPKRSAPITINPRKRSASVSSSSSGSTNSPTDIQTPISGSNNRINIPSPSSSPILSYVLAQSPTKSPSATAATYPFMRKFGTIPAFEEDERDSEIPATAHARRASTANIGRFPQQPPQSTALPECQAERGTNLLRRLSLSFAKSPTVPTQGGPQSPLPSPTPPNTAVSPTGSGLPYPRKPGRSATLGGDIRKPRRAPSPMGERMLKGHFDGFN